MGKFNVREYIHTFHQLLRWQHDHWWRVYWDTRPCHHDSLAMQSTPVSYQATDNSTLQLLPSHTQRVCPCHWEAWWNKTPSKGQERREKSSMTNQITSEFPVLVLVETMSRLGQARYSFISEKTHRQPSHILPVKQELASTKPPAGRCATASKCLLAIPTSETRPRGWMLNVLNYDPNHVVAYCALFRVTQ